jgi:hypothetical protein
LLKKSKYYSGKYVRYGTTLFEEKLFFLTISAKQNKNLPYLVGGSIKVGEGEDEEIVLQRVEGGGHSQPHCLPGPADHL